MVKEGLLQWGKTLKPGSSCLICHKHILAIGGRRIVAQAQRGVTSSDECTRRTHEEITYFGSLLLPGDPGRYLLLWGDSDLWNSKVLTRAAHLAIHGKRPWFCQICGGRACNVCLEPLPFPMGSDHVSDDGEVLHSPIFPITNQCPNLICPRYVPARIGGGRWSAI